MSVFVSASVSDSASVSVGVSGGVFVSASDVSSVRTVCLLLKHA